MKHKLLFIITIFLLFNSCNKKGFEDRIKGIVGTWKFIGTYYYQQPSRSGLPFVDCDQKVFYVKINANNTFETYDSLNQKIYSGTIKSYKDSPHFFHIKHGFKKGIYKLQGMEAAVPFCGANQNDTFLVLRVDFVDGHPPENNLFFDGNKSEADTYVLIKI